MSTLQELFDTARKSVDDGSLPACQLAVARDNEIVAFETFGDATNESRFFAFSATKPIVASATWHLIADGSLDLDKRVADYIPEFAANGKDAITVEQVLLHTAGFPNAELPVLDGNTSAARRRHFAEWALEWEPGSRFEYHATSAHWILADLIETLTGTDFRDYVDERVGRPLGLQRVLGVPEAEQQNIVQLYWLSDQPEDTLLELIARPETIAVGVPGGGAVMTAADLARFYQGVINNPGDLWDPKVHHTVTTDIRCTYPDPLMNVAANRTLGLVVAGDDGRHFFRYGSFGVENSPRSFGHAGAHMQVGWGDPETGISFAYFHNGLDADQLAEGARGVVLSGLAAALEL